MQSKPWMRSRWAGFALAAAVAVAGASLCVWLHAPLPWLIGALFATATVSMAHGPLGRRGWPELHCPLAVRSAGQWAIGCALGLYFTPQVVALVVRLLPWILLGIVYALVLGLSMAWALQRLTGVDRASAVFAMAIGGASEMAVQGERNGADVGRVAASHSLRVLIVVTAIPFAYKFLGLHGMDPYEAGAKVVHLGGLAALAAATCAGAWLLRRFDAPNAWVIGPLLVALVLTAFGIHWSALPGWIINAGQVSIGISLGTRFTPEFFRAAPRYLGAVALIVVAAGTVSIGFAWVVHWGTGLPMATMILATSPGGISEMSLTAKNLQLGVPVVTAFHVMRMSAMVLVMGAVYRWLERRWPQPR